MIGAGNQQLARSDARPQVTVPQPERKKRSKVLAKGGRRKRTKKNMRQIRPTPAKPAATVTAASLAAQRRSERRSRPNAKRRLVKERPVLQRSRHRTARPDPAQQAKALNAIPTAKRKLARSQKRNLNQLGNRREPSSSSWMRPGRLKTVRNR